MGARIRVKTLKNNRIFNDSNTSSKTCLKDTPIMVSPPSHSPLSAPPSLTVASQADKLRTQQQLEALQNKYVGTGHADTTAHEWTGNIARDSYASYQGHPPLLHYMAIGMGVSMERVRMRCMEGMVLPVGPAPVVEE